MPLPTASERAAQYAEKKAKLLQAKKDREQPRALPKPAHPVRNKTLADDGASRAREYAAKRRPVVQQKGAAAQSLRKLKARVGAQSQVHRIAGVARSLMCALPEGATEHELLELLDFGGTIQQVQLDGSNALLVFGEPSQAENVFHSAEDPGFVLRDVTLSIQRLGAPMEALVAEGDAFLKAAADGNLEHVAQVMGKADEKGIQHCHLCDRTQEGLTPLMLATRGGHNAVVETLLKSQLADALRSHVDCEGRISLAQAILAGHATLIPALLSDGPITPAAHDLGMATPLHHAIAEALPLEQIRWLLPSGDLSAQDLSGCTAMMLAIASDGFSEEQLIQVSDLLVTRETLHLTDTNGNSALHLALMHRRYKVAVALLERCDGGTVGAFVNLVNAFHQTALTIALVAKELDVVGRLLGYGSRISASDADLCVPLQTNLLQNHKVHERKHGASRAVSSWNSPELGVMAGSQQFSDMEFFCTVDGATVPAHRAIVAHRSGFLLTALSAEGFEEARRVELELRESEMRTLLGYLYSGQLPTPESLGPHVGELYKVANFLELKTLLRHIEEVLFDHMCPELWGPVVGLLGMYCEYDESDPEATARMLRLVTLIVQMLVETPTLLLDAGDKLELGHRCAQLLMWAANRGN
eukprot:TRINITY_DN4363_c0_g1_i17.p1 TRINITY_DN4363_c0_g1~~TRINITY_DN4363_c0_g1_i17.p1  ORF type:complete len:643 (-),score=118.12 TRINITY_DN4363_c0_g1_i17:152-2080(-)